MRHKRNEVSLLAGCQNWSPSNFKWLETEWQMTGDGVTNDWRRSDKWLEAEWQMIGDGTAGVKYFSMPRIGAWNLGSGSTVLVADFADSFAVVCAIEAWAEEPRISRGSPPWLRRALVVKCCPAKIHVTQHYCRSCLREVKPTLTWVLE